MNSPQNTLEMVQSSSITPAQQAFIEALEKQVREQFSSQLDGTFEAMSVPNGFYWSIQFGPNNYYNENSLNQINMQAIRESNGVLGIAGSNFTTLYNSIMGDVVFVFSQADQKAMNQDEQDNQAQIQAVINSWEASMGSVTPEQMKKAAPPTKLGYIQLQVQTLWDNDINKIPTSLQDFRQAYQTYQVSAQVAFRLQSQSAAGIARLDAARRNSKTPTAKNGGLQTAADSYYQPFGPFPTNNKIQGDLQTLDNKATISLKLSNFTSRTSHLSVGAGAPSIEIPILDFLSVDLGGGTSYTLDQYTSSSTTLEMKIVYPGITLVGTPLTDGNLNTDNTLGWYANDVLTQAIANTDRHQTGYSLTGTQFPVDEYFGEGKQFSRIRTWVLSQQPTIEMTFCAADTSRIESDFKENASVSVKLLGLFNIGSVSQSYEVKKVDSKSTAGCVTLTLGPSKVVGSTPAADSTAYVVGGVPSYPPNDI